MQPVKTYIAKANQQALLVTEPPEYISLARTVKLSSCTQPPQPCHVSGMEPTNSKPCLRKQQVQSTSTGKTTKCSPRFNLLSTLNGLEEMLM